MKFKELFLTTLALLSLGACNSPPKDFNPEEEKKLAYNMAVFYNLTGELASQDVPANKGTKLAFSMLVEKYPLIATGLGYTLFDCSSDEEIVAEKTKLISKRRDLVGAVGLTDSNMIIAAIQEIEKAKKVFVATGATSPHLVTKSPYIFLTSFGDNVQTAAAAQYAYQTLKFTRGAILFDKDVDYTRLLANYFKEAFTSWGGQIISEQSFPDNASSIAEQLKILKTAYPAPDFIYLGAMPAKVPSLVKAIRTSGFNQAIIGSDSFDTQELVDSDTTLTDIYFTTHIMLDSQTSNPEINSFVNAYIAAYNEYPSSAFAALGFDAANLFFEAISIAHSFHHEDILKAFEKIKNYKGVTGSISYSETNHAPIKPVTIVNIHGDRRFFKGSFIPENIPPP